MSIIGAFIVPHPPIILAEVGRGEEKKIEKTIDAYNEAAKRIAALKPDTIVLTSPHSILYSDYFHISPGKSASGNLSRFGAREVSIKVSYDTEFVSELIDAANAVHLSAGTMGELDKSLDHGSLIPLVFINKFYHDYKIIRIGLSGFSAIEHYIFGKCIAKTSERLKRRTVFIASGDLSHKLKDEGPYGFAQEGPKFDSRVTMAMKNGDFMTLLDFDPEFCSSAAECGLKSFQIMAGALDKKAIDSELLSYEGPFGVGYAVAAFSIIGEDEKRAFDDLFYAREKNKLTEIKSDEDDYVKLARLSLETYVKTRKLASLPPSLPEELLNNKAGVFVSLKKHGQLRGCIGTTEPVTSSIAAEIIRNAVSAGAEDPRFAPVEERELDELIYSVDVLGETEKIDSADKLDVLRYGVIVSSGRRRGLLLPNLEGIDTVEEQIAIAKQKAGIQSDEAFSLERFEVVRHI